MVVEEALVVGIVEGMIVCCIEHSGIAPWIREKIKGEPEKTALKNAVRNAATTFEGKYPDWTASLFDLSFFQREGAPILAEFLVSDGNPSADELVQRWAASLPARATADRDAYIRTLEPVAADFLGMMAHELKAQPVLRELNNARALERAVAALIAIQARIGADHASPATRRAYLHWLIERNEYLDPRGTVEVEHAVHVKLDEIYVSLTASRDDAISSTERKRIEQELADLAEKTAGTSLSVVEMDDRRDQLLARLKRRRIEGVSTEPDESIELARAVMHHDRLVILGDPGSGKSTLLRYLAFKHAEALSKGHADVDNDFGPARFPILIRIAEYAQNGTWKRQSLSDFLADYHTSHDCPGAGLHDLLATELATGNCLVLLDGLDEIVSADDRRGIVEKIEDFVRRYDDYNNRFILTSRIAGYRSAPLGEPFVQYTVREMDDDQIRRFLGRWCLAVETAQTPDLSDEYHQQEADREIAKLIDAIQRTPGVRRLASNPLLLRTLALIHRTGARIPEKRIELYRIAADILGHKWRTAQGVPETALISKEYLTRILRVLAYWLHTYKSTGLATVHEVYDIVGKEWATIKRLSWDAEDPDPSIEEEVRKLLEGVHVHTGLFVERAPNRYGFMHLTFEEYYVARYLVAPLRKAPMLLRSHLHDPRWEEPILLALGFVSLDFPDDAEELLETAVLAHGEQAEALGFSPSPHEDLLGRDFLFAVRCLGDGILDDHSGITDELMHRMANELVYRTDSGRFTRYRQALEHNISFLKDTPAAGILVGYLTQALDDSSDDIRLRAAMTMGSLGVGTLHVTGKVAALLQSENDDVRLQAALLLRGVPAQEAAAVGTLIDLLHSENDDMRFRVALLLRRVPAQEAAAVDTLVDLLQSENDDMRFPAAYMLQQMPELPVTVVGALTDLLQSENDDVRLQAALLLRGVPAQEAAAVGTLIDLLHSENDDMRFETAFRLQQMPELLAAVVGTLLNLLHSKNEAMRFEMIYMLQQMPELPVTVVGALTDLLQSENDDVRLQAAELLRRVPAKQAGVVGALTDLLQSENDDVRLQAAELLQQVHELPVAAEGILTDLLHSKNEARRLQAALLLMQVPAQQAAAEGILIDLLQSENDGVRFLAAYRLQQVPAQQAAAEGILIDLLQSEKDGIRLQVTELLQQIPELLAAAKADDIAAILTAWAMRGYHDMSLVDFLIASENQALRSDAVLRVARKFVHQAIRHEGRTRLARLLGQFDPGTEDTIIALWNGLCDRDNEVRTACAEALARLAHRFPAQTRIIEGKLLEAITDPRFDEPDTVVYRSGHDYAFDALWLVTAIEDEHTSEPANSP